MTITLQISLISLSLWLGDLFTVETIVFVESEESRSTKNVKLAETAVCDLGRTL